MESMDNKALSVVKNYIIERLKLFDDIVRFDMFIVWKCKVLQNWKYLISTNIGDGMYYEITYNGDKKEWYLDAYKKYENKRIKEEE